MIKIGVKVIALLFEIKLVLFFTAPKVLNNIQWKIRINMLNLIELFSDFQLGALKFETSDFQ